MDCGWKPSDEAGPGKATLLLILVGKSGSSPEAGLGKAAFLAIWSGTKVLHESASAGKSVVLLILFNKLLFPIGLA